MDRRERIEKLREWMRARSVDACLIPTSDYHSSEYIGEFFKGRKWISGFTGSAGTLVVSLTEAGMWVDGRYFIQAEEQLAGSGIKLFKMGQPGVPPVIRWLTDNLPEGGKLAFDGKVLPLQDGVKIARALESKGVSVFWKDDPFDGVWDTRPPFDFAPADLLDLRFAGESGADKVARLRAAMAKKKADLHLLTSLDDLAWLFNMRGDDIPCNPVVFSFAAITQDSIRLFLSKEKMSEALLAEFDSLGVQIDEYDAFYPYLEQLAGEAAESLRVLIDPQKVSYALWATLHGHCTLIEAQNPTTLMKAVKNPVEQENLREAHRKDALAMVHFLYWMEQNEGKISMSELSVGGVLDSFRMKQPGNRGLSFGTISAYGIHAALPHYSPTLESDLKIEPEGFYLVDSGGQYDEGTTDITRTFAVGPITEDMKVHYTAVLAGMLSLGMVQFPKGVPGSALDVLARLPLWDMGEDYNHGTGHGVGFLLNVHEGPNSFRWGNAKTGDIAMEPGMMTSDEPGYYREGEYGIRTENLLMCVEKENGFLGFEHLTLVPIDQKPILWDRLTPVQISALNEYHKRVYETLADDLPEEEREWLRAATAPHE